MIKFDCKINVKHNFERLNALQSSLPETIKESVEDILKNIQGYAIRLERGHNEQGILVELVNASNNEIKGRVYADPNKFMTGEGISYLFFEYFGTGSNAEMEHIGKTQHFIESGYTEWFIPVNKVTRALNYPTITIYDQQFYVAHGSKANHFMGDAEFQSREKNKEIVENKLKEMVERCCE